MKSFINDVPMIYVNSIIIVIDTEENKTLHLFRPSYNDLRNYQPPEVAKLQFLYLLSCVPSR